MPYIPKEPPYQRQEAYRCEGCGVWFMEQSGFVAISCCVLHAPGTCCHMGEIAVNVTPAEVVA